MNIEYDITDIKEINSKRRLIYINYEPAFALYPSEIRRFSIKKDTILSENSFLEITDELLPKRAKIRAMNLLKSKDYTVAELRKKLKDTYYPDSAVESAIDYVSAYGYLDDLRYAENYVNFKGTRKSRKQVELFLRNKGIEHTIIEQVCFSYYEENCDMELNQAVEYLQKKTRLKDIRCLDYTEKSKLCAYLYRNGFSMDIVRKALDIVVEDQS